MTKEKYYVQSGKYSLDAVFLSLLFGFIGSLVLSFVYAYALYWIPFVYINFFVTIGFGFISGLSAGYGFSLAKGRNDKIASRLGLITGIFAYYLSWIAYTFVNFDTFVFLPSSILKVMEVGLEEGFWSLGRFSSGGTVKGILLGFFWVLEALIIIITSWIGASVQSSSEVFCEKCNRWISKSDEITDFEPVKDYHDLAKRISNNDYSELKKKINTDINSMSIQLSHCSKCNDLYILNAHEKSLKTNSKGVEEISTDIKISNLIISKSAFETIKKL